ncbi:DUF4279 domain-containing protein [Bacillus sp. RG28]|uniref:DUF4279 domain-containing protein n=1 Tax=Gottfriedia endophytica TaxID=2820819 RepID=A0A940NQN6_9BACI|nr:DUF4279 domain-containing protein [Gottfriedia endophytica]MBP0725783.1 DUF4279 domain-containing protein [Gottfriedia endophytica]
MKGFFSFIIRDEKLDFDRITANLNVTPTEIKKKGSLINSLRKMKDDLWTYKVKYDGYEDLHQVLEKFLIKLSKSKMYINEISKIHNVYIFFSARSNLGQMGFELNPNILQMLVN